MFCDKSNFFTICKTKKRQIVFFSQVCTFCCRIKKYHFMYNNVIVLSTFLSPSKKKDAEKKIQVQEMTLCYSSKDDYSYMI